MSDSMLMIPRGRVGLAPIAIDLAALKEIENRIPEVGFVTPQKAPELLSAFNVAYLDLAKFSALIEAELVGAKHFADRLKAVVTLDKAPTILREKGLTTAKNPAGSEDLRSAVLNNDPDYQKAQDWIAQLECYKALIDGKKKAVEMAYHSVRKILGDSNAHNYKNPNLIHHSDEGSVRPTSTSRPGFGSAKY